MSKPYASKTRIGGTSLFRNAMDKIMNTPNDEYEPDPENMFTEMNTSPNDNFEPVYSQSEPETDPTLDKPIFETPFDEVMNVIRPKKKTKPEPEPDVETNKRHEPRVEIFTAATPGQLKDKLNQFLSNLETNPKLKDLDLESIQYAANNQGYTAMLVCKKNSTT